MTDNIDLKVNQTLSATEKLLKFESEVSKNATNQAEFFKGYDEFIKAIQAFKDMIEEEALGKGKLDIDEELSNEIWQEITHLENPSKRKNKEEKALALQNSLFWDKLYSFQESLNHLQDKRLKRGQKVEKIDPAAEGDKD